MVPLLKLILTYDLTFLCGEHEDGRLVAKTKLSRQLWTKLSQGSCNCVYFSSN